jgi:hypothetical protein
MTSTTKGQLSVWRLIVAICTVGISALFIGVRKPIGKSKIIHHT